MYNASKFILIHLLLRSSVLSEQLRKSNNLACETKFYLQAKINRAGGLMTGSVHDVSSIRGWRWVDLPASIVYITWTSDWMTAFLIYSIYMMEGEVALMKLVPSVLDSNWPGPGPIVYWQTLMLLLNMYYYLIGNSTHFALETTIAVHSTNLALKTSIGVNSTHLTHKTNTVRQGATTIIHCPLHKNTKPEPCKNIVTCIYMYVTN